MFLNRKLGKKKEPRKLGIQDLSSKIHFCSCLRMERWKECGLRKVRIHKSTIQVSQLQVLEKKTVKRKWTRKSRIPKSIIQSPKFILAAVWQGNFERNVGREKLEFTDLPSKTHNSEKEGTKKSRNPKSSIQSPKFILAAVWQGNFERKNWN